MANMSTFTYARSNVGLKELKNNISGDIKSAVSSLTGSAYSDLLSTVRKYWVGADEKRFEEVLKTTIESLSEKFKEYDTLVSTALENDSKQFTAMQQANASQISGINI